MKELDVIMKAISLGFSVSSLTLGGIKVENRGLGSWAVLDGSRCLNHDGGWEYEPLPSNRTDEFLARCRFPLEEAIDRATTAAGSARR